jgi:chromosome partitioning protein
MDTEPQIIALANFKGGTGKTTSAAFLAHAFQELGHKVLLVDADTTRKAGSLSKWAALTGWDIRTERLTSPTIHRELPGLIGRRFDVVIIDTPPLEQEAGIVESAMRAASAIVLPMAPALMELAEVPEVLAAAARMDRHHPEPVRVQVLLNRTHPTALSAGRFRRKLEPLGCQVLRTEIRRREKISAEAFGRPITGNLYGYFSAASELEKGARK